LSTLTKILIVLLTISSILLCGVVVTYVGSAVNFKEKYDSRQNQINSLMRSKEAAVNTLNKTIEQRDQKEAGLNESIKSLQAEITRLENELANATRKRDDAIQRMENWQAIALDFSKTTETQVKLAKDAFNEKNIIDEERIKNLKELEERTAALIEKMALIDQLEKESRRLREENAALQNKVDQFIRQYGKTVSRPTPVTQLAEKAKVAPPATDIGLKGVISAVNLENSWAELSIGSANGVRKNMVFHVIRGDNFICDIVIFEVDPEKAVGVMELVQETPRVGDTASTNL
jgi:transcriptional regulator with GAF, ATPase, and Fis domain